MQYQVIKITGATQSEFNGEHRILTIPNSSSLTFELATTPSATTATGAISASLPPLGWEKPFSSSNPNGGGKAAYRPLNLLLPSRPFLRVVDELDPAYTATYAKYAKVGIVEDMTDIDTMLGAQAPFDAAAPDKNWVGSGSSTTAINGWARWYYARSMSFLTGSTSTDTTAPSAGIRNWVIVGSKEWFYILPTAIFDENHIVYGFGCFDRISNADMGNWFLSATINYTAANTGFRIAPETPLVDTNNAKLILHKNYLQGSYALAKAAVVVPTGTNISILSGYTNYQPAPQALGYIAASDMCVIETSGVVRGVLPSIAFAYQNQPISHLGLAVINNEVFLAIRVAVTSNTTPGLIFFKVA